jgi:hypothetical protein
MPLGVIRSIVARKYTGFRGIDLLNPETAVDFSRSPDCKNVWKSYTLSQSNIIQTRPGLHNLKDLSDETLSNNNVYSMYVWDSDTAIVHIGTRLVKWDGFPGEGTVTVLKSDMQERESVMFYFKEAIYILDGYNYLKFNGTNLIDVKSEAYTPTTTIARSPSGGGEPYQDVNLLQPKRKNSFIGDGTSTAYVLDSTNIDSVISVTVNGTATSDYTADLTLGKITFNTAPSKPGIIGQDNVVIEFSKQVSGYTDRIEKCQIAKVFDNRIFFTGNADYPNAVFHSELNNPAYISDLSYYECGTSENPIKSIVVGNNLLWVFKRDSQTKDTIFYLTPTLDTEEGRIYPTSQGNVSVGCISKAVNYKDSILFFSRNGLEGIRGNITYEQSVSHKSSLIDSKLINMSNYEFLKLAEFNGYLVVAIDNIVFLADYRQTFQGVTGTEYEWYLWELPKQISCVKEYRDMLYVADSNGVIYELSGTHDLENTAIDSYWITPRDTFGYTQHLKKINKRGAILKIKNIQNSRIKVYERTNKKDTWNLVKEVSGNGFDYGNVDYGNFSYVTADNSYVVFRVKEKKIIDISLKIGSDILDKPFGLIECNLEAFISGYVKRS